MFSFNASIKALLIHLTLKKNMLHTIKGVYNHGQIILDEMPPTTETMEVFVTFTGQIKTLQKKERTFGVGKGIVLYMSPDFNEPLEDLKDYM